MDDDAKILRFLKKTRSIAVIGLKDNDAEVSYRVASYLKSQGYDIFPVNPGRIGKEALGRKFTSKVNEIDEKIDLVEIFRRPEFLEAHAEEILEMKNKPAFVWFQSGIVNDKAAARLEQSGIEVIQDRCMFIEHKRLKHRISGRSN